MNSRSVFHLISYLVLFLSGAIALSGLAGWGWGDDGAVVVRMLLSAVLVFLPALLTLLRTRGASELSRKDGFAIVTLGWLVLAHAGALPYLMTGAIPNPVDALFETMSGFTTTGSTILTDIEILPRGVIFWRSMTQWMGGMGVLLLCVAILPFLGVGGMQLYRAEMPGPSKDRLTPRIANTAKLLWGVYVLLTLLETGALMLAGMNFFDAINHSLCTMATGGFSPHNASIAHFDSPAISMIISFFMLLAGINFALHYRALRGDVKSYWRSAEVRLFLGIIAVSTLLISVDLILNMGIGTGESLLAAIFQVISIITTTGFATEDYDLWPLFSKTLLFLLLFSGGCAGSTAGGIKIMRTLVVLKECGRQIRLFLQPQAVLKIRLGQQTVQANIVSSISAFYVCFFMLFIILTLMMTLFTDDLQTAASSVIACMGNVGPGFGAVGPTSNFADIAGVGKILLSFAMLLGRLELFTVLVLFSPGFWKK
ncbi:MAG: TrkH family potassium uptake protein [Kiritimatiellae bacterium]|nr:TrkH family potassium uptake protein [Kiritimatiellia bacterium]